MGVVFNAVLWNVQKKRYDWTILALIVSYFLLFTIFQLVFHPEITAVTLVIRATGTLAFLMLHLILWIGPLCRINPGFLVLLYNRRHLGVSMSVVALVHGILNIAQFHSLGNVDPLQSIFISNLHYDSLVNFPFQVLGFFALIILLIMASTSHDFWLKNLGPGVWKRIHMCVYLAYALLVGHVLLGVMQEETSIVWTAILALGVGSVGGLHIWSAIIQSKKDENNHETKRGEFHKVCHIDDIQPDRATICIIENQNIAVFKYDGKLSAINNVCRHQHGPLGEGKIVDGCITCPWHGYQYLPQNGQSPPPFEEKVETYDVRLEDDWVWVNPDPYPAGTERPPCQIQNNP